MSRPIIAALVVLLSIRSASGQQPSTQPAADQSHEQLRELMHTARQRLDVVNKISRDITGIDSAAVAQQTGHLKELEDEMIAACERIEVDPRAEEAAADMRRGRYEPALRLLKQVITERRDDPYASYLAGMCALELERYGEAVVHFGRVLKGEPQSHTARLLRSYSRRAARCNSPLSDEDVQTCFDAALAEAAQHVDAPPKDEKADDIAHFLAQLMAVPEVLKDPLLYKLDCEALAERGPQAVSLERLLAAARESDDVYALFLGWLLAADETTITQFADRLEAAKQSDTVAALLFHLEHLETHANREGGAAYERDLADLRQRQPDEGLWILLSIPYRAPDEDTHEFPPLSDAELATFAKAANAPKFADHQLELTCAARRLLTRIESPWAVPLARKYARLMPSAQQTLSDLSGRLDASMKQRLERGDADGALEIATNWRRILAHIEIDADGLNELAILRRCGHDSLIAKKLLLALPPGHTEERLKYQQLLLDAEMVRQRFMSLTRDRVQEVLPVTAIRRVYHRLFDFTWNDWELARIRRIESAPEKISTLREQTIKYLDYRECDYDQLLAPGILGLRELLPELQRYRSQSLDDVELWALVWTLGDLKDADSVKWLIEQLGDEREWLRYRAAEALRKITGEDHGLNADDWRAAPLRP